MTTTEQFTIHEVVQMIKEDKLRLPTFQRNYVWEKTDIVKLFSTLFSDNTFGAISAIKTTMGHQIFSTRSFIDDLQDKYQLTESNYMPNYTSDDPLYLILDGQQRLQSFYLAFDGDFDEEDLYFNTENCTVAFYETRPNDNCIPIKKVYNKMSRVSYEQTAKFFRKDKNENIFKFFYHISFTKRITFLISEPSNELEKDRERFTNLFIKLNTSGKGLDKWETFRCIITGMRPETVTMFSDLTLLENKIKGNKPDRVEFDSISTLFDCLLNVTQDEYSDYVLRKATNETLPLKNKDSYNFIQELFLKRLSTFGNIIIDSFNDLISIEDKINYIVKTIDAHFAKIFPVFIKHINRLQFIMLIESFDSDFIINMFREFNSNIDNFNIQRCYIQYAFKLIKKHFTQEDDCWLFIYLHLSHIVSENVARPNSYFLGTSFFDGEKHSNNNYKLGYLSQTKGTKFFYSIRSLLICCDGRVTKLIDDNTTFFFDISDEDRKNAIEKCRKTFSEQWQIRDNEWNIIINN